MNRFIKWRLSFLKSLQLQFFIALMSLPFLVSWGLPISIFSIFTTLLFGPFLTVFLLVSSFIFFTELLHIPNTYIVWILERITSVWLSILNCNKQWWLIGFTKPPFIFLCCIIVISIALLHSKYIRTVERRVVYLMLLFVTTCILLKLLPFSNNTIELIYKNKNITLLNQENQLIVVDDGALSAHTNHESFIVYTLMPDIIQKIGKMHIDHLVLCHINKRTFDAVTFLLTKMSIDTIYIPWWTGKIPVFAWSAYVKLKKAVAAVGGKIISVSKTRVLFEAEQECVFIESDASRTVNYYDATYPHLSIKTARAGAASSPMVYNGKQTKKYEPVFT
jgi:hypothetical protein